MMMASGKAATAEGMAASAQMPPARVATLVALVAVATLIGRGLSRHASSMPQEGVFDVITGSGRGFAAVALAQMI